MSDPHGWQAFWEHYDTGLWEPSTRAFLERLQPGDLFVDVGAWIGPVTRWARERGAHVIAVEPDPVAIAELRRLEGIEIWEGAVTTHGGPVRLVPNPKEGGEFGDSMSRIGETGVPVESWTLPAILNGRAPSLVKIDVEGYELELCPILMPWLAECEAQVQVACHGELPSPEAFVGFPSVAWPKDPNGNVLAGERWVLSLI